MSESEQGVSSFVAPRAVRVWLWTLWALVLAMVVVGGITRLTGSGLSITEWEPIVGAVPPTNDADWLAMFERYRATPQFHIQNAWMQLADFKRIFFWEYVHRLLGRLLGAAFFVPWLYFLVRRRLTRGAAQATFVALALGGAQGLLGWLMVASGLVDEPRVSHYRLAAHLLLAFSVGQYLLWLALQWRPPSSAFHVPPIARRFAWALVAVLALQSMYGAFMAGKQAGLLYATFPDMNGRYAPAPFFAGPVLRELVDGPAAIHWVHRVLGFWVLAHAIALAAFVRRQVASVCASRLALACALAAFLQLNLGALTVIRRVPIDLAVGHQALAYVLLSLAVALCHTLRPRQEAARA
jgi:cytochrome c oxidase assembly protein subunit 15